MAFYEIENSIVAVERLEKAMEEACKKADEQRAKCAGNITNFTEDSYSFGRRKSEKENTFFAY